MSEVTVREINQFCQEYLHVSDFKDYCNNGLQVEGTPKVRKIICGVSLSQRLIEEAIKKQAQLLLVHHGLFSDLIGSPPSVKGVTRLRLKLLLEHGINLMGFHLPLDAHPEIGNNISLCKLLGVRKTKPVDVGFVGSLNKAQDVAKFVQTVNNKLNTKSYTLLAGPSIIRHVGIISGGASRKYEDVGSHGADVFLCGDVCESVVRGCEEAHINLINAGHYNTERLGVMNLGRLLSKKFKLSYEFIEVPCEV